MNDSISKQAVLSYIKGVQDAVEESGISLFDVTHLLEKMKAVIEGMGSDGEREHRASDSYTYNGSDWEKEYPVDI